MTSSRACARTSSWASSSASLPPVSMAPRCALPHVVATFLKKRIVFRVPKTETIISSQPYRMKRSLSSTNPYVVKEKPGKRTHRNFLGFLSSSYTYGDPYGVRMGRNPCFEPGLYSTIRYEYDYMYQIGIFLKCKEQ